MRIHFLPLTLLLLHMTIPVAHGAMGALHHQDNSGGTNLQKISAALKQSQEQQDRERAQRMENVTEARAQLNNCATLENSEERKACEAKYSAIVKGALRACGADCP